MVNIITVHCYLLLINKTVVSKINKMVVNNKIFADHNHRTKHFFRIIKIVKLFYEISITGSKFSGSGSGLEFHMSRKILHSEFTFIHPRSAL